MLAAISYLSFRVYHRLVIEKPPDRLHLDENAPLSPAPPLPADDRAALRTGLQQLASLQAAIRNSPDDPRANVTFARSAVLAGDLLSASSMLKKTIASLPQASVSLYDLLGRCEIELASYSEALRTYQTALQHFPQNAVLHVGQSRALAGLGRRSEVAKPLLEGMASLQPADVGGRMYLAAEFDTMGNTERALELVRSATVIDPDNTSASIMQASLLHKIGKEEDARGILQRIVDKDKNNGGARRILAQILDNPRDPHRDRELAEHYYLEALRLSPKDADSSWRLGQLCQEQKRYIQAAYLYTLLLESIPDSAAGRQQLAVVYAKLGRMQESAEQEKIAQQLLKRSRVDNDLISKRERRPLDITSRLALARQYKQSGRFRQAFAELQACFTISPKSEETRRELFSLYNEIGVPPPDLLGAK